MLSPTEELTSRLESESKPWTMGRPGKRRSRRDRDRILVDATDRDGGPPTNHDEAGVQIRLLPADHFPCEVVQHGNARHRAFALGKKSPRAPWLTLPSGRWGDLHYAVPWYTTFKAGPGDTTSRCAMDRAGFPHDLAYQGRLCRRSCASTGRVSTTRSYCNYGTRRYQVCAKYQTGTPIWCCAVLRSTVHFPSPGCARAAGLGTLYRGTIQAHKWRGVPSRPCSSGYP